MIRFLPFLFCCFAFSTLFGQQNQVPLLSNIQALINWSDNTLLVTYDVVDAENDDLEIILQISNTNGVDFVLTNQVDAPSGDVGFPVSPGTDKQISMPITGLANGPVRIRITALDNQPLNLYDLVAKVDSQSLKDRLLQLEGIRHRTAGTAKLQETRDSILSHFEQLQLGITDQAVAYNSYSGHNFIGNIEGTLSPEKVVIVDAHYDTVSNSPGADDNGSGTVGMMEISNILAPFPSLKTVRYIGFDLEETGLTGSTAYVQSLPSSEDVLGVFNFEMIGFYSEIVNSQEFPTGFNQLFPAAYNEAQQDSFRGNFITNVGNGNSTDLVNLFHQSAQTYAPDLKVINVVSPGTGSLVPDLLRSDHAPFWLSNRPALMLTDGANFRNDNYHTTNDKSSNLNFGFMQNVCRATLASVVELAEIQHGSWQTVIATETLDAENPSLTCEALAWKNTSEIQLKLGACAVSGLSTIQVFSLDGRLLQEQKIALRENSIFSIKGNFSRNRGAFVRILNKKGQSIWAKKV